jgi:arylsulfatase A-like enzyme
MNPMRQKISTLSALVPAAMTCSMVSTAVAQVPQKPNIIFLMTDQQRWDAIGAFNPIIKTPAIDALAKQGIIFKQAVCQSPMSTPSRNSMMTGLYTSQLGLRQNGAVVYDEHTLPVDALPEMLRKAGYQTAGFGKTHWGRNMPGDTISTRGFEVRYVGAKEVGLEKGALSYQDNDDPEGLAAYRRETANYGGGEENMNGFIGGTSTVDAKHHRDGWVAEKCFEFIENGIDASRPLFLYLSFLKPHAGFNIPAGFESLYHINDIPDMVLPPWENEPGTHLEGIHADRYKLWRAGFSAMTPLERRTTILRYYANCSWLDSYFGKALAMLKERGMLENALVIFVSDHGEMLGERYYRFTKYNLYESSVRVPMILGGSYIEKAKQGTIDQRCVALSDLYTTLQHVAGGRKNPLLCGIDLLDEKTDRGGAFSEMHEGGRPAYMWRTKDLKLIMFLDPAKGNTTVGELYDLNKDPNEWHNVYSDAAYAARREQMKTALLSHLMTVWSKYPSTNAR